MARQRKKERRAAKSRAAGKAAAQGSRKRQGTARVLPLTDLSIKDNHENGAACLSELVRAHADLDLAKDRREAAVAAEADMKENFSPESDYFTADDRAESASFALLSTDRSLGKGVLDSPLAQLGSLSSTPVLRRVFGSPTRARRAPPASAHRRPPRVEIAKREVSTPREVRDLIQMRRLLDDHVPVGRVRDVVFSPGDARELPTLLVGGMEVGGLGQVAELDAAGILGQMLASTSFTRGFLEAGPGLPSEAEAESQDQLAKASIEAYAAVEELRRSLDITERRVVERSGVSEVLSQDTGGATPRLRLHHSWDPAGKSAGQAGGRRARTRLNWGNWEWPSTQALLVRPGQDREENEPEGLRSSVKESIKYLCTAEAKSDTAESENENDFDRYLDDLLVHSDAIEASDAVEVVEAAEPAGKVGRGPGGFRWGPFLLGVVAVPAVALIASKGIAPVLCSAARAVGRARSRRRELQGLVNDDLLGGHLPKSFANTPSGGCGGCDKARDPVPGARPSDTSLGRLLNFGWGVQEKIRAVSSQLVTKVVSTLNKIPGVVGGEATRYVCLEAGDSLWGVSAELYGDGGHWRTIAEHNGIGFPFKVMPGRCLELPPRLNSQFVDGAKG